MKLGEMGKEALTDLAETNISRGKEATTGMVQNYVVDRPSMKQKQPSGLTGFMSAFLCQTELAEGEDAPMDEMADDIRDQSSVSQINTRDIAINHEDEGRDQEPTALESTKEVITSSPGKLLSSAGAAVAGTGALAAGATTAATKNLLSPLQATAPSLEATKSNQSVQSKGLKKKLSGLFKRKKDKSGTSVSTSNSYVSQFSQQQEIVQQVQQKRDMVSTVMKKEPEGAFEKGMNCVAFPEKSVLPAVAACGAGTVAGMSKCGTTNNKVKSQMLSSLNKEPEGVFERGMNCVAFPERSVLPALAACGAGFSLCGLGASKATDRAVLDTVGDQQTRFFSKDLLKEREAPSSSTTSQRFFAKDLLSDREAPVGGGSFVRTMNCVAFPEKSVPATAAACGAGTLAGALACRNGSTRAHNSVMDTVAFPENNICLHVDGIHDSERSATSLVNNQRFFSKDLLNERGTPTGGGMSCGAFPEKSVLPAMGACAAGTAAGAYACGKAASGAHDRAMDTVAFPEKLVAQPGTKQRFFSKDILKERETPSTATKQASKQRFFSKNLLKEREAPSSTGTTNQRFFAKDLLKERGPPTGGGSFERGMNCVAFPEKSVVPAVGACAAGTAAGALACRNGSTRAHNRVMDTVAFPENNICSHEGCSTTHNERSLLANGETLHLDTVAKNTSEARELLTIDKYSPATDKYSPADMMAEGKLTSMDYSSIRGSTRDDCADRSLISAATSTSDADSRNIKVKNSSSFMSNIMASVSSALGGTQEGSPDSEEGRFAQLQLDDVSRETAVKSRGAVAAAGLGAAGLAGAAGVAGAASSMSSFTMPNEGGYGSWLDADEREEKGADGSVASQKTKDHNEDMELVLTPAERERIANEKNSIRAASGIPPPPPPRTLSKDSLSKAASPTKRRDLTISRESSGKYKRKNLLTRVMSAGTRKRQPKRKTSKKGAE